jgi:hypothetical protein
MKKIKSAACRGTGKLARLAHSPSVLVKGMAAVVTQQQPAPTADLTQRFGICNRSLADEGGACCSG